MRTGEGQSIVPAERNWDPELPKRAASRADEAALDGVERQRVRAGR